MFGAIRTEANTGMTGETWTEVENSEEQNKGVNCLGSAQEKGISTDRSMTDDRCENRWLL